eukprot:s593_g8.t2
MARTSHPRPRVLERFFGVGPRLVDSRKGISSTSCRSWCSATSFSFRMCRATPRSTCTFAPGTTPSSHPFSPLLASAATSTGTSHTSWECLPKTLLVALLKEMATRAKLVMNKESAKQSAVEMGWLTQGGQWSFIQWNPQTAQLDPLESVAPRDHEEILQDIDTMIEAAKGDTVKRFSSAKTLVVEPQAEWVEFILELGIRDKGHQLWDLVLRFNGLHPPGARIRRDRPGLSGLAETIRNASCCRGGWQFRRLEEEGVVVGEQSSTVTPITIDVPEEARGLQHCMQAWHSRHYRAALYGSVPELVCIHLSRFRQSHGGTIVKDVQALPDLMEVIRLPLFGTSSDLRVTWLPFQVCAAVLHFGPTVHRGHYRAILRSGEKIIWLKEDNQSAEPLPLAQLDLLSKQVYLVWCSRIPGRPRVVSAQATTVMPDPPLVVPPPAAEVQAASTGVPTAAHAALSAAMARQACQRQEESQQLEARIAAEKARCGELEAELQEAKRCLQEERRKASSRHPGGAGSRGLLSSNPAEDHLLGWGDCEELRAALQRISEEQRPLEKARLEAEEATRRDRQLCESLRAELQEEQRRAETSAAEALRLRSEVQEATNRASAMEASVQRETEVNAALEEQCAAACTEWGRSKEAVAAARKRLEERGSAYKALRLAVWDYHQKVSRRLAALEQALLEAGHQGLHSGRAAGADIIQIADVNGITEVCRDDPAAQPRCDVTGATGGDGSRHEGPGEWHPDFLFFFVVRTKSVNLTWLYACCAAWP